jgi:outer membrane protein assembly factor BamB/dienelactone hydrolase
MIKPLQRATTFVTLWVVLHLAIARAQADGPKFTPPEGIHFRTQTIISEGTRIAAEVFSLKSLEGQKLPTIILCHGWGGEAQHLRPEAIAFARAGYLAVAFDYRGWGASDSRLVLTGPAPASASISAHEPNHRFTAEVQEVREVVDPIDQTTDLLNAIHWVQGEPQCDTGRIGLWGSSYSGGHVAYAAARDPRVKAIVCQVPALDSRWVVATPEDRALTFRDATRRARGETGYPKPGERVIMGLRGAPIRERMVNYAPIENIDKATDCAMLFILAEKEEYFANKDHGIKAYERAKGPKKLVIIPGITHYGIYFQARGQAQKLAIAWFDEHLKGIGSTGAAAQSNSAVKSVTTKGATDPNDWPMYNHDVIGTRHNSGERAIDKTNAGRLMEKWRFPAEGSDLEIGVIHATPVVVDGYVYFGTATDPTFYKLSPDGKVRWSYRRNPARGLSPSTAEARRPGETKRGTRFQASAEGILGSALVTEDTVYVGDIGGWFYALDRATGSEQWKLNARAAEFPGAHPINVFFASPILVEGKLIVGGGTLEQLVAGSPFYRGSNGRGFVMALEPKTGRIAWKYDVGPKPEPLKPPITIKDSYGDHVFHFGPGTSSVWSTPSFDAESHTIFFGTDVNTAPRRPTADDPKLSTRDSCAMIALDVRDGSEKWVTQINPGDVWTNSMRGYDPKEGRYKDQAIGDTPKIFTITVEGKPTKVVGVGCKNGGFYVLRAGDGRIVDHTPIYTGPPSYPLSPAPDRRMLALPGLIGGVQTGCATDGATIFTNGIDCLRLGTQEKPADSGVPPTAGRVVAISLDTRTERWRHDRPKVASLGGPPPKPVFTDIGDPVASGIAVANGVVYFTTVASGKLVALDAATGAVLKEFGIGPVWSGPSVSRGRVYVGTGNTLFTPADYEAFFPKKSTGILHCYGLPGDDEVARLGAGKE